ncbi:MAG: 2-oxoacid:acceptor oxidoreductase family protein [Peptococcaceae bacterium]|jgi:2-oxoglutarate ferredoxin oxidoreductase subunit gamma|nr:2-oxoacid:acceptor oxidoreductase family protein [Peptococcaceae bacterium]MDH7524650.1 2-oxoacid:acceptor oxidoreductase family protein [Peptococcaceae bacterium]
MRKEIVLSGYGGQGLILAGVLLGEAVAIHEGMNVTQNQSYGVQARGGECKSEVIISDEEINYAEIEHPDILLAMSQSALNEYGPEVKDGALVIVDSSFVKDISMINNTGNIYMVPITEIACAKTNKAILANVVALGVLSSLSGIVSEESLEKVILKRAPAGTEEINLRALAGGIYEAKQVKKCP